MLPLHTTLAVTKYYSGDQIKKNRNDSHVALCGTEEVHTGFGLGDMMERDLLGDLGVDGSIMFNLTLKKLDGDSWTGLL